MNHNVNILLMFYESLLSNFIWLTKFDSTYYFMSINKNNYKNSHFRKTKLMYCKMRLIPS